MFEYQENMNFSNIKFVSTFEQIKFDNNSNWEFGIPNLNNS